MEHKPSNNRIAILTPSHISKGGVERFVICLQKELQDRGLEVVVLAEEDLGSFQRKMVRLAKYFVSDQIVLGYFLGKAAERDRYSKVITNGLLGWSLCHKKSINVQHGTFIKGAIRTKSYEFFGKYMIKRYWWSWFEKKSAKNAAVCVAVSEETKTTLLDYYRPKQIVVIDNAIDTDFFKPGSQLEARKYLGLPSDKRILLFVGRLGSQKAESLIREIAQGVELSHNNEMVVGAVFGQKFDSKSGIVSIDKLSYYDSHFWYQAADVLLLPSRHEGSSLALLEAMSSGVPFLASPVGLVAEFQDKKMFLECIVPEQKREGYLEKLRALLAYDNSRRADLSGRLREIAIEKHSLKAFGDAYYNLITTL